MHWGMTNGRESKTYYQGEMVMLEWQQKIIGYLLKLYYIDIALAVRGETCQLGLGTLELYILGLVGGQKVEYESEYLSS